MVYGVKIRRYKFVSGLLIVLTLSAFINQTAYAAGQSITISPTSTTKTIQPGASFSDTIQVINQGTEQYLFTAYAAPYHVTGEAYNPGFTRLPGAPDVVSWFTLPKTTGNLAAGKSIDLPYTVTVPSGTLAGGYYATVFAETQATGIKGVVVHKRVGTIFYIAVAGPLKTSGDVLSWRTNFLQKPPLLGYLRIANKGNVHFPVTLNISVKNILGHTVFTQTTVKEVLPETIRSIPVQWQKTPIIGLVKVHGNVEYLDRKTSLSDHYVLIMSTAVRVFIALVSGLIILFFTYRIIHSRVRRPLHGSFKKGR